MACRVSAEKSAVNIMGVPLYIICRLSLAALNNFSLSLIFANLITMCLDVFLLCLSCMGLAALPELGWCFLSHVRDVLDYNLFKYFLRSFLFLFFFRDPYNSNVGAFNVVPEVSETVLSSFHSFFFILLCSSYFYYFTFQVTYPFFCLSYSAIDPI